MNTHADKKKESKSQSFSDGETQGKSKSESTLQFVDNRPEAIAQLKLQEIELQKQERLNVLETTLDKAINNRM